MAWIDSHVHIWFPDTDRYPVVPGTDITSITPRDFTAEVLFRHARPSKVGRIVLVQPYFYGADHSYLFDSLERYPDVFRTVARYDRRDGGAADEMAGLVERGVTGFRIVSEPGKTERWLQDPNYEAMFRAAASSGQAICPLTDPGGLSDLGRMCAEHPDTVVVIDHMARIGAEGSIDERHVDALCALAEYPKVHVKVSAFYALGQKKPPHDDLIPMVRRVINAFGPERTMRGSDAPHQVVGETYEDSISLVRDRLDFLSDAGREQILSGTAEQVFFFK